MTNTQSLLGQPHKDLRRADEPDPDHHRLGHRQTFPELRGKLNGHAVLALVSLVLLKKDLGKAKNKPKFRDLLSKSRAINILSAARLFLFGARDVWFVVALPVFLASWVIGYGMVQSVAPYFTGKRSGRVPDGRAAIAWACTARCWRRRC